MRDLQSPMESRPSKATRSCSIRGVLNAGKATVAPPLRGRRGQEGRMNHSRRFVRR